MERKRKYNKENFQPCECGGDWFVYCVQGRTQRLKCGKCGATSKKIKSCETTINGTKEHSEPG